MILITGGLGFIGRHTARALLDLGQPCVLAQRRSGELPGAVVERLDITDADALADIGARHRITGVVHLAGAFTDVEPIDAALRETTSLLTVLAAARRWSVPRVLVASTIGVYGLTPPPYVEDAPLPLTGEHVIPAMKKAGEVLADFVSGATDLQVISMRITAIWGPGGRPASRFLAAPGLVHAAVRGTPPPAPVYADDAVDMCYARDCGRAIALLQVTETLRHRVYNVGSAQAPTNGEIVAALGRVAPTVDFGLKEGRSPGAPTEVGRLDITRLRADTGFRPEFDTDRAVGDYVAWLRAGHER